MSSQGKRASILKKQPFVSHNLDATATATSSSTFKGNRKIEFNRKKSIKEFLVGEDVDTIWGNSYEVSADGTPSSALDDVTLGNSTCPSLPDEQNKENHVQLNVGTQKEDELRPSPNSSNGSWDLSVTLADDERRRIRSETSVMFSHSLNTTDRLFVDPIASSESKLVPKPNNLAVQCDVQAMDISPLKGNLTVAPNRSPRKMIYYNPKEELYVEINDVPQASAPVAGSAVTTNVSGQREVATAPRIVFQTPTRGTLRSCASDANSQSTFRGTSFNVSETWNSHPHALMHHMKQQQSHLDDFANMSSDVDTTLAITNTVAKLLESGPNLTIPTPTTMELDESTTTEHLPTNALARARPSFLPSQRAADETACAPPLTPPIDGRDAKSPLLPACEDTNNRDISSPLEGGRCPPMGTVSLENVSLIDDLNQPPMIEETMQKSSIANTNVVNKSSASNATAASFRHGLSIDFGISSLSLKLAANSPETPTVNRPKILRPTLPLTLFDATHGGKTVPTPKRDLVSRTSVENPVSTERKVEQLIENRQTINVAEDMETSFQKDYHEPRHRRVALERDSGSKPIETTCFDHPQNGDSPSIVLAPTTMTVAMEDSVKPKQSYNNRPTIHDESKSIVEESAPPPSSAGSMQCIRATMACPERMEITQSRAEGTVSAQPSELLRRRSIYEPDPMKDHSMEQTVKVWWDERGHGGSVRGTIHEKILLQETTAIDGQGTKERTTEHRQRQPARRTYYPDESIKEDTLAVQSVRKTFYPEETIKVDRVAEVQHGGTTSKTIVCNESMMLDVCTDTDEGIGTETSVSCKLYGKNIDELSIYASGARNVIDMKMSRPTICTVEQCEDSVRAERDHQEVALDCRRLTTHAVRDMDEDNGAVLWDVGKKQMTVQASQEKMSALLSTADEQNKHDEADSGGKRRHTTHSAEKMDETIAANSRSALRRQETHNGGQESPMNLTKGHKSNEGPKERATADLRQRSEGKQRFTIIEREEMEASQPEAAAFVPRNSRHSIYRREDMDATEIEQRRRTEMFDGDAEETVHSDAADMDVTKGTERSRRSRIQSEGQIKTRFTAYGHVNMADTSCFNHTPPKVDGNALELQQQQQSQLSIYQPQALDGTKMDQDQLVDRTEFTVSAADISNYRAFLANHEKSQNGAEKHPKQRLTTYYMEGMGEAGLDSTRLSREREQLVSERERIKPRPSTYHVEAMDVTTGAVLGHETSPAVERPKHPSVGVPSPTESKRDERSLPPHRSQRMRQSVHHPEDMEDTLPVAHGPTESGATSRRSQLRSIVQHTAIEDMEGFSLLADDDVDVSQQRSQKPDRMEALREESIRTEAHQPRGTILHTALVVDGDRAMAESARKFVPKYRPTICHAEAMVEDTVTVPTGYRSANETKPHEEVNRDDRQPSSAAPQRKSSVCMEETMLPIAVRIERRKSAFENSPILCLAEHPPSFTNSEETVERTDRDGKSRQTIHQASKMDMTLGARESMIRTVVVEPDIRDQASSRRTIYNSKPMVETPPHAGRSSRGDAVPLDKTVASAPVHTAVEELDKPSEEPASRVVRKQRQTMLIPLDMDVDGEVEPHGTFPVSDVKLEELTEDCVLRNVQSMAISRGGAAGGGFGNFQRVDAVERLSETLTSKSSRNEPDRRGYVSSSRFVPPASTVHDLSDISMCNLTMRPELPQIGNITGMMSLREITEPLPPVPLLQEQNNSVSVICRRVDHRVQDESVAFGRTVTQAQQSLGFVALATPNVAEIASEDEFYDADDGAAAEPVDPLSLTKSRHLTMKFVDVEQLERTRNHRASVVVPSTTSKRGHAQLLCSPALSRALRPLEDDPLQVTTALPQQPGSEKSTEQQTPRGPMMKRPRTSNSPDYRTEGRRSPCDVKEEIPVKQEHQDEPVVEEEEEEILVKEEHTTMARVGSQTIIHDPSVFVIDGEDDLLDDESNPPCCSLSEEILPSPKEERPDGPLSVGKLKELSFYRDFANLTIDNLDTWDEANMDDAENGDRVQCISVSDEDSLALTPPKGETREAGMPSGRDRLARLFGFDVRPSSAEVLDSTIASEFMYELRQKHPPTKPNACCGTPANECLCRTKRVLARRKEACDVVWGQYTAWFEALRQHIRDSSGGIRQDAYDDDGEDQRHRTLEEQIEELNWRLLRTKLEQSSFGADEMSGGAERGHDRPVINGQYPETPSVVFLCENLQSYLSKHATLADTSPPQGASLPAIPRITLLIANKLSSDSGTRWQLDCSAESEGVLVLRHRTLRSVVISVQLAGQAGENGSRTKEGKQEERRLERIQVRECQQQYIHSPKLLLAHIEFMRQAKATTERTLRSTYRTVASLMGLWQRFDELLRRVFDSVNRLMTIARNNDALLCYDAEMERFFVEKYFHRCLAADGKIETNTLTVHFNWIGSLCASGVSFKRPIVEAHKLVPGTGNERLTQGGTGSTDDQTGLMFLECLLWNVTKQFES